MEQNKSTRNENGSPRQRKVTLNDKRKNGKLRGYQDLADAIWGPSKRHR